MTYRPGTLALVLSLLAISPQAFAHISLQTPDARYSDQKSGPCGRDGDLDPGEPATVFEPGATITVSWNETVNHPGHFRISFDDDGVDDFGDPASFEDLYTNNAVLLDDIPDTPSGGPSSVEITLPDIECERCTLQVVQVMTDKPPYGDGNDLYYQCANLALRAGATPVDEAGTDTTGADTSGADTSGADTTDADTSGADTTDADTTNTLATDTFAADTSDDFDEEGACGCQVRSNKPSFPWFLIALGALGLIWQRRD